MKTMHPEWRITSLPSPISPLPPSRQQRRLRSDDKDSGGDNILDDDSNVDNRSGNRDDDGNNHDNDIVGYRDANSIHSSSGNDKRRLFGLAKDYHFIRSKGGKYLFLSSLIYYASLIIITIINTQCYGLCLKIQYLTLTMIILAIMAL